MNQNEDERLKYYILNIMLDDYLKPTHTRCQLTKLVTSLSSNRIIPVLFLPTDNLKVLDGTRRRATTSKKSITLAAVSSEMDAKWLKQLDLPFFTISGNTTKKLYCSRSIEHTDNNLQHQIYSAKTSWSKKFKAFPCMVCLWNSLSG